jgi:hypothetical protein
LFLDAIAIFISLVVVWSLIIFIEAFGDVGLLLRFLLWLLVNFRIDLLLRRLFFLLRFLIFLVFSLFVVR